MELIDKGPLHNSRPQSGMEPEISSSMLIIQSSCKAKRAIQSLQHA